MTLSCARAREAISARADGESEGEHGEPGLIDAHIAACPGCRSWEAALWGASRSWRIHDAGSVPDLLAPILARMPEGARRVSPQRAAAIALLFIAAAQTLAALTHLVTATEFGAAGHLAREQGAFELALAVGFLAAALRARYASVVVLLAGVLSAGLVVGTLLDTIRGTTSAGLETHHVLALAGTLLAWLVRSPGHTAGRDPVGGRPADRWTHRRWA